MSKPIQDIQPLAWSLAHHMPDALSRVPVLRIPPALKSGLFAQPKFENKISPVTSLYSALASLAPEVIGFEPGTLLRHSTEQNPRWMYVYPDRADLIQTTNLEKLIRSWLLGWLSDEEAIHLNEQWFKGIHWSWEYINLPDAPFSVRRRVLPALIARYLVETGFQLAMHGSAEHPLLLVPLMDQQAQAQLMTPPIPFRDDKYSYVLKLWLQQLPDGSEALMQRLSVRRWLSAPFLVGEKFYLPKQAVSVYWQRDTGYLSQAPLSHAVYAQLKFKKLNHSINAVRWVGLQAKTLNNLNLGARLPEFSDLLRDPKRFQEDLLIVKSQRDRTDHAIETGVWSNDHRDIYQTVSRYLADFATPHTPAQRAEQRVGFKRLSFSGKKINDVSAENRYAALRAMPYPIGIEVYTDKYDQATKAILEEVGALEGNEDRLKENPLRVMDGNRLLLEIKQAEVALDNPLTAYNPETRERAVEQRRRDIKRVLKPPSITTGALVSIQDYRKKKRHEKFRDPYNAIRWGLADTERTSQFIIKSEKDYALRLQNSVRDLLRILGYRYNPMYQKPEETSLPQHLDLFGLWLIQLNARNRSEKTVLLPLVIHASATGEFHVMLPDATNGPAHYPSLHEGILAASQSNYEVEEDQYTKIMLFFRRALESRNRGQDALLLVWEQNSLRVFGGNNVVKSLFPDGAKQFRVATLRHSQDNTAPMCIPVEIRSKYQGVFQAANQPCMYYSLHNVGERHTPPKKDAFKNIWQWDPGFNPSTVLIWFEHLQSGDQPAEWAWMIHRLRKESSHTDIPTILPQPLHNAELIRKFMSRAKIEEAADDDEEEALSE